jgi:hypothetical protein
MEQSLKKIKMRLIYMILLCLVTSKFASAQVTFSIYSTSGTDPLFYGLTGGSTSAPYSGSNPFFNGLEMAYSDAAGGCFNCYLEITSSAPITTIIIPVQSIGGHLQETHTFDVQGVTGECSYLFKSSAFWKFDGFCSCYCYFSHTFYQNKNK